VIVAVASAPNGRRELLRMDICRSEIKRHTEVVGTSPTMPAIVRLAALTRGTRPAAKRAMRQERVWMLGAASSESAP
jgi:hypothetical protein